MLLRVLSSMAVLLCQMPFLHMWKWSYTFYPFSYFFFSFLKIDWLIDWLMIDTEREREAETQAEGEAGSMPGARGRNRSRDSRITPWAKGRRHTAQPPRDTHPFSYWCDLFVFSPSGRPTTLYELMRKADIWLIRTYWDFEYPHPLLPHFDFVGGLHCKPAKSLPTVPDSCFFCFVSSGPFL